MRVMRLILALPFCALLPFGMRVWVDSIVLEPHYFRLIQAGLLNAPLLIAGLPATWLADLACGAAVLLVMDVLRRGRLPAAVVAAGVSIAMSVLGRGDLIHLPATVTSAWVLTGMAGAYSSAWVAERILPAPDFDTLV